MSGVKTGGCLCKAIQYEIAAGAEPVYNVLCHCVNCKKSSGSQVFCASIFLKDAFQITSGTPKEYKDYDTDSGKPLHRFFCDTCGSSVYALTPLAEHIVSVFSGGIDNVESWWVPNKEQYVVSKSHWLPDFVLQGKEGVPQIHQRGPSGNGDEAGKATLPDTSGKAFPLSL